LTLLSDQCNRREQAQLPGEPHRGRVRNQVGSLPEQNNGETGKTKNEKEFTPLFHLHTKQHDLIEKNIPLYYSSPCP
jgi:hypothetical protein